MLITVDDTEQFNTLSRYVELYQQDGPAYWIGYSYNASDVLVDANNDTPSNSNPVLDQGNYAANQPGPEADGTCLLIGMDGSNGVRLIRQDCSSQQRYICVDTVSGKSWCVCLCV